MQRSFIFDGGASKRYHTVDTLKVQDIASHSFGVAWLCELLTQGQASKNLIMAALAHDLAEHIVGDIPSPSKRAMGMSNHFHNYEMGQLEQVGIVYHQGLSDNEKAILQLADMIEGMLFCLRERKLGNCNVGIVFGRFHKYAWEVLKSDDLTTFHYEHAASIVHDINMEWKGLTDGRSE